MGCCNNYYRDFDFMEHYNQLQAEFTRTAPLFSVRSDHFPLSTKGMAIVDRTGRRVKLAGGNWSGGHAARHCVGGLDRRPISELIGDIKDKFGMNCVRLTFSLELFRERQGQNRFVNPELLSANKQLFGKTAKEIFIYTVEELTKAGLMVILNNHTSKSQWCCSDNDGDGLWFNNDYPEEEFFSCLEALADQFHKNPRVIGIDLRNEIRPSYVGRPTWGDGSKFDWRKAAETAGNRIHQKAPGMLIIVGGMNYQLDFRAVMQHPLQLKVPHKLVYSGHFYGFSWGPVLWDSVSEEWFREKLFNEQLYVRGIAGREGVPFLLGEFGENNRSTPWKYLIKYVKELDLDWTYWCLDGYKCDSQEDETYGVWTHDFRSVRHPELLEDLKRIANTHHTALS